MGKLLSITQFAAIALGQSKGPWHLGNLCALYNQQSISLKQSIAALSAAEAVVFVNVASKNTLPIGYSSTAVTTANADGQLNMYWYWDALASDDIQALAKLLKPSGCSISYLSPGSNNGEDEYDNPAVYEFNIIGIAGTFAQLASLNIKEVPALPSKWAAADITNVKNAPFLLNNLSSLAWNSSPEGGAAPTNANGLNTANLGSQPLGALSTGVSANQSGLGLLGVAGLNAGDNAIQYFLNLFNRISDTGVKLAMNLDTDPMLQSVDNAIATFAAFKDFVNNLQNVPFIVPTDPMTLTFENGVFLTVSEVDYQAPGATPATFSISAYTINTDGTNTGGVVS